MKTMLKVVSIIYIVLGGLGVIGGILTAIFLAGAGAMTDQYAYEAGVGYTNSYMDILTALGVGLGIFIIIGSVIAILTGVFGVKGAGGKKGPLTAGLVFVIIGLLLSLAGTVAAITMDAFSISGLLGYVLPVLYLISGFSVRKELQ